MELPSRKAIDIEISHTIQNAYATGIQDGYRRGFHSGRETIPSIRWILTLGFAMFVGFFIGRIVSMIVSII